MSDTTIPAQNDKSVDLVIGGMTCASCAARVEKRLNKLDGVTATVNYSTERARVAFPDGVAPEELIAQVEAAGYTARLPQPPARSETSSEPEPDDETEALRTRLITPAALAVPVILLAMVPALQFDPWQWLSLTLAAPVVTLGAWPFPRAAWHHPPPPTPPLHPPIPL